MEWTDLKITVPRQWADTAEAIRWYRMAAEQGHHDAQVELRILLRSEGKLP